MKYHEFRDPIKQNTLFVVLSLLASSAWCETIAVRAQPLSDLLRQPELSGRVESIPVRVSDQVAAGTVLVKLDCRYHQSRLEANKAQRMNRQKELRLDMRLCKR